VNVIGKINMAPLYVVDVI